MIISLFPTSLKYIAEYLRSDESTRLGTQYSIVLPHTNTDKDEFSRHEYQHVKYTKLYKWACGVVRGQRKMVVFVAPPPLPSSGSPCRGRFNNRVPRVICPLPCSTAVRIALSRVSWRALNHLRANSLWLVSGRGDFSFVVS